MRVAGHQCNHEVQHCLVDNMINPFPNPDIQKHFGGEHGIGYESGFTTRCLLYNFLIVRSDIWACHMPLPSHGCLASLV